MKGHDIIVYNAYFPLAKANPCHFLQKIFFSYALCVQKNGFDHWPDNVLNIAHVVIRCRLDRCGGSGKMKHSSAQISLYFTRNG